MRFSDGMRRPVSGGMLYAPNGRRARSATERRPAMKKIITVQAFKSESFILEQKLPTTPEAMKQTFGKIPRSLIALETGTHSPWVSRRLTLHPKHSRTTSDL